MFEPRVVWLFAGKELREALRGRALLLYGAALIVLVVGLSSVALVGGRTTGFAGFSRTTATLVNVVLLIVPLLSLLLGGQSIAGERESGTLDALLVQPVSRAEVYLGKALGLSAALLGLLSVAFGVAALLVARAARDGDALALATCLGSTALLALASLSVGLLISALSRTRAKAMALALVAWFALAVLADLGVIGASVALGLRSRNVFVAATLNPLEAFKILATLAIAPRLDVLGPAGVAAVHAWGVAGARAWLCGVLAGWMLLPASIGFFVFTRSKES
jgi:Cu-processing system permease protein